MQELRIAPDRTKVLITLNEAGKIKQQDRIDPGSARARRAVVSLLGVSVSDDTLLDWIEQVRSAGEPKSFKLAEPASTQADGGFIVRPLTAPRSEGLVCKRNAPEFLTTHLPSVRLDHVIEWSGEESCVCLDVDYHEHAPPSREWLRALVHTRLTPKPIAWHFSRGGGLHCFYVQTERLDADELAACAALRFRLIDRSAGLELKTVVRGPGSEPVYHEPEQDTGGAALVEWFGTQGTDEADRDDWLESEGLVVGGRYDHTKCPIAGTPDHESKGSPVQVGEEGVFCHRCAGLGLSLGTRRPGFAPWPAILGAPSSGPVGNMVRNFAHWGHAKWILREQFNLPEALARRAYRAALKARHGKEEEERIGMVFDRDTDDYARSGDSWYSIEKSHAYTRDIQAVICRMPAACNGDGKPNQAAVCDLLQAKDAADRGYPSIERVHGFKIAGVHLSSPSCRVGVINPALPDKYRPKYVVKTKRMPEAEAWAAIETVVPRVDHTLVKALLCAFGSSQETKSGMTPLLFVSGPAGAAKTSTVKIATAIAGTRVGCEAVFDPDTTRFRQAIYEGASKGPVVVINELLKDAARRKLGTREALDLVLNLTPDSSSWAPYRGPVTFGRVPAVVITEPVCPVSLRDETQLARRIRNHRLHGRKDEWKKTLPAAGLSDFHMLRTVSPAVNAACDSILSGVCDDFFGLPLTWDAQADILGVRTIEEDEAFEDLTPQLLEFFRLVCEAPDLSGRDAKRYGRGYKRINRSEGGGEETDLVSSYSTFADGAGADWLGARRLTEKDWSVLLKTDVPVEFDCKSDGASVFVRFRVGRKHADPTAVNREIKTGV